MGDAAIRSWSFAGRIYTVECPVSVLQDLHSEAEHAASASPSGGVESGGILFGRRDSAGVHIEAAHHLDVSYHQGALFTITAADLPALDGLIQETRSGAPHLAAVGWYVCRTHRDLDIDNADIDIWDRCFPDPLHCCLMLRSDSGAAYLRIEDGSIVKATAFEDKQTAAASNVIALAPPRPMFAHRRAPAVVVPPPRLQRELPVATPVPVQRPRPVDAPIAQRPAPAEPRVAIPMPPPSSFLSRMRLRRRALVAAALLITVSAGAFWAVNRGRQPASEAAAPVQTQAAAPSTPAPAKPAPPAEDQTRSRAEEPKQAKADTPKPRVRAAKKKTRSKQTRQRRARARRASR